MPYYHEIEGGWLLYFMKPELAGSQRQKLHVIARLIVMQRRDVGQDLMIRLPLDRCTVPFC